MKAAYWALIAAAMVPAVANANQVGDVIVRAGVATVRPSTNSPSVLGSLGSFHASNNTQMGLTLGYMWTDNIGTELLAATPFRHKIGLNESPWRQCYCFSSGICRKMYIPLSSVNTRVKIVRPNTLKSIHKSSDSQKAT